MSSKEIESILLSENDSSILKINDLLEANYKDALREIFNIFFDKVLLGPIIDVEVMLDNIEKIIWYQDVKNTKTIISAIKYTIYKFSNLKVNENIEIRNIKFRLLDMIRKLNMHKEKVESENLYNVYHSIIFNDRDLSVLELVLKEEKNILRVKDNKGNDLLYNILDYYASLSEENSEEIDYFKEVIMLFFRLEENALVKNAKNYYTLLESNPYKDKKHVTEITKWLYGFADTDIVMLKKKYDISTKFHDEVMKELEAFEHSTHDRVFIDAPFVTIDDEEAMCLDDALGMVPNKDGSYTFYVGITDVPSLVPFRSRTFYEALRRVETLYLCDDAIGLYPDKISYDLCSLTADRDNNAIIYKFLIDPYFNIDLDSLEIIKGILRVRKRLSYHEVNKQENISIEECKMIENMYFLTSKLKGLNIQKEEYRRLENLIHSSATYHHSLYTNKSISANIVQESMLLVNSSAPRYFHQKGLLYTYRNLDFPKDKMISKEIERLLRLDKSSVSSDEYQRIVDNIKSLYLNAYYSTENKGHEGLGYDYYSHSTSSARRFEDSFNQYLTYFQLFDRITNDRDYYELETMAKEVVSHINDRKRENSKFASEYNYLMPRIRALKK